MAGHRFGSGELADAVLAVGGTARALGRVLGARYGAVELDALVDECAGRSIVKTGW